MIISVKTRNVLVLKSLVSLLLTTANNNSNDEQTSPILVQLMTLKIRAIQRDGERKEKKRKIVPLSSPKFVPPPFCLSTNIRHTFNNKLKKLTLKKVTIYFCVQQI